MSNMHDNSLGESIELFPPFYDVSSQKKFMFQDRIFHSIVINGPELCKQNGMTKTRLTINTDGSLTITTKLSFEISYIDGAGLYSVHSENAEFWFL